MSQKIVQMIAVLAVLACYVGVILSAPDSIRVKSTGGPSGSLTLQTSEDGALGNCPLPGCGNLFCPPPWSHCCSNATWCWCC